MHWQTKHPVEFSKNTHHTKHNTHQKEGTALGATPPLYRLRICGSTLGQMSIWTPKLTPKIGIVRVDCRRPSDLAASAILICPVPRRPQKGTPPQRRRQIGRA